jgi:hypothetical protein
LDGDNRWRFFCQPNVFNGAILALHSRTAAVFVQQRCGGAVSRIFRRARWQSAHFPPSTVNHLVALLGLPAVINGDNCAKSANSWWLKNALLMLY